MSQSPENSTPAARQTLKSLDWSTNPLGDPSQWPNCLKIAVNIMMDSQFPMFLTWGPERILLYNDSYGIILGKNHPAAMGTKFEILGSEIWEDLLPYVNSVDEGKPVFLEDMRLTVNRFGHDEDAYFTFSYSPLRDEHEVVRGLFCAVIETTRKIITQEALTEKEVQLKNERNRLLSILENFPEPITIISMPSLTYSFTNARYRQFYLNGEDVVGKKIAEVIPEGEEQGFVGILNQVYTTGLPFRGDEISVELRRPDGTLRKLFLNIVYEPIRDANGRIEAILAGNFDVTALVQAKEQAQIASISKTAFLANMSHEIRTPMTAVLGFSELLRDDKLSDEQKQDALERIDKSGRSLLKIIDDILDISKVESGKLSVEKVLFSPFEVVTEVVALFKLQADQKVISINSIFSNTVPEMATSDPARVRQILINLVGNAVKFTVAGEVKIEVDTEIRTSADATKQFIVFKVSDTGIGISGEDQARLFQPFVQADEAVSRKFGGTGLGLVLSKRLSEQLGGDLNLTFSQLGLGSEFIAKIEAGPFAKKNLGDTKLSHKKDLKIDVNSKVLESARILVVDDVLDNQFLMRKYLESVGAKVDVASNGQEAIDKALANEYDVVIMDIQMPVVDGIQATKLLRSQGYKMPIVALTAHAMKIEAEKSLAAGCNEHLTKPISRQNLVHAISRYFVKPTDA